MAIRQSNTRLYEAFLQRLTYVNDQTLGESGSFSLKTLS
jgi:hypothetical protein